MRCRQFRYRYEMIREANESGTWGESRIGKVDLIARSGWRPAVDVYETEDQLSLTIELAGVNSESINIALYEDALVIKGQRHLSFANKKGIYRIMEIQQGSFCLELPIFVPINVEQVEGNYEQGLLQISLNKIKEEH